MLNIALFVTVVIFVIEIINSDNMLNQANFIKELENQSKSKLLLQKIQDRFSKKPYLLEYRSTERLAFYAKFLFAIISISCAVYWLYTLLLQTISFRLPAFALAVLLLVFLEIFKFRVLPKLFTRFYSSKTWDYGLMAVNIMLMALSVFLSVKGIEKYNREQRAILPVLVNEDSLRQDYTNKIQHLEKKYEAQINSLREEKANSKKQVMWQGKINMYHQPTATELANYTQQINTTQKEKAKHLKFLQEEKKKHLEEAIRHNKTRRNEALQKTSLHTANLIAFAFLNEFLAFVCLWYMVFYQYRSLKEIQLLEDMSPIQVYPQDIGTLFRYVKNLWGNPSAFPPMNFGETSPVDSTNPQKNTRETSQESTRENPENRSEIGFKQKSRDKKNTSHDSDRNNSPEQNELNLLKHKLNQLEETLQNRQKTQVVSQQHTHSHSTEKEKVIIKQPPKKEVYNPEKILLKHLDVVQEIRNILPKKPNITEIHRKTKKDRQTIRKVYQAMQVLGQCEVIP